MLQNRTSTKELLLTVKCPVVISKLLEQVPISSEQLLPQIKITSKDTIPSRKTYENIKNKEGVTFLPQAATRLV
jgi:hypothetical protein